MEKAMINFSVILLLYNSEERALINTLDSIIYQKNIEFEIILADDCSENGCIDAAASYLDKKGFSGYKLSTHAKNVGTTQNIYDALSYAEGSHVKCIGAGDLLYSETTLSEIYDFMTAHNSIMCFGKIQAFYYDDNKLNLIPYYLPSDIKAFEKENYKSMQKDIIQNHGWIVGASMFYNTEAFRKYLKGILKSVKYCEDLLQVTLLLNNEKISYYPHGAIYYEVGSGISTGENKSNTRLQNDHSGYWKSIYKKYPDNKLVKKGYRMQKLQCIEEPLRRKASIILHNPSYVIMMIKTIFQKKSYEIKEKGLLS